MQITICAFKDDLNLNYNDLLEIELSVFNYEQDLYDTAPWGIEEFKYNLPDKDKYSFVIKVDDTIVGFSVGYAFQPHWLHISRVAVVKEFRGKGLGSSIISHQLKRMRLALPEIISIDVNRRNTRAISVYQEAGFRILNGIELQKYLSIRARKSEEYLGEGATHTVMVITRDSK